MEEANCVEIFSEKSSLLLDRISCGRNEKLSKGGVSVKTRVLLKIRGAFKTTGTIVRAKHNFASL